MKRKINVSSVYLTGYLSALAVAFMWVARKRIGIDFSTLLVLSGISVIILILGGINRRKEKSAIETAKKINELRDTIGTDIFDEKNYFD